MQYTQIYDVCVFCIIHYFMWFCCLSVRTLYFVCNISYKSVFWMCVVFFFSWVLKVVSVNVVLVISHIL